MRLVCTLQDQHKAYALSTYLMQQGIDNQLEINKNTDWGSPEYGTDKCLVWVYEEDQLENALKIVEEFQENPEDPRFYQLATDVQTSVKEKPVIREQKTTSKSAVAPQPMGPITIYLLMACILLFVFTSLTTPVVKTIPPYLPYTPVLASPVQKNLMYDYPHAYEIVDQLINIYGLDALENPDTLPEQGKQLVHKFEETPYWHGIYEKILHHFQNPEKGWNFDAPLFEKIRQGEIWRIFTPCLLHAGIFHLFFNMIWLVILGKQMEQRLGKMRYALFIIPAAIIPNTAQYLMSGPDFAGFSGVLCAMLAFIWVRQKKAAWEGYQLQPGTMAFIAFFILFMLTLQIVSFFLEVNNNTSLAVGIANTAHLIGALVGYVLAQFSFFSWQTHR